MSALLFERLRPRESDSEHTAPRCVAKQNPSARWKADGFSASRFTPDSAQAYPVKEKAVRPPRGSLRFGATSLLLSEELTQKATGTFEVRTRPDVMLLLSGDVNPTSFGGFASASAGYLLRIASCDHRYKGEIMYIGVGAVVLILIILLLIGVLR
jgi:hypothetical protein